MAPPKRASFNVCFCDIDGTLVHYPEAQARWGNELHRLSIHAGRPLSLRHEMFMLLAGEITGPSVIPGYFMYVERVRTRTTEHARTTLLGQCQKRVSSAGDWQEAQGPQVAAHYQVYNFYLAVCRQAHNSSEDKGTACIVMLDMLVVVLPRV